MNKVALVFWFCIFVRSSAVATSVVVIWNPYSVVFASDTLAQSVTNNGIKHLHHCKIRQTNNLIVASSGTTFNAAMGLNVNASVSANFGGTGTDIEKANRVVDEIYWPLLRALQFSYKQLTPEQYAGIFAEGGHDALSIAVARIDKSGPIVTVIEIIRNDTIAGAPDSLSRKINVCSSTNDYCREPGRSFDYVILGRNKAVRPFLSDPTFWKGKTTDVARRIIEIEIKAVPDTVGPPIDVVTIDATGVKWEPPYGECHKPMPPKKTTQGKKGQ